MKKFKKLLSCAAAATLAVTGIVGGASLGASANTTLPLEVEGPYTEDGFFIASYNRSIYYQDYAFELSFKYDTVGTPETDEEGNVNIDFDDTFEFLVFDTNWDGWNKTTVGPAGYDKTSDITPTAGVTYTVEVPIEVIESKLSTGGTPYGINIQTGLIGTSVVSIESLQLVPRTTPFVQQPFTITGNYVMGTASAMTVEPAGAATVNASQYNIEVSAIDLSAWVNPTVDVTVTYAEASSDTDNDGEINYSQAEIEVSTGAIDPETGEEIFSTPDPNYVLHEAGQYTYTTEIPNTTVKFVAAYQDCTVTEIHVYDNTDMNTDNPVSNQSATTIKDNMGLAWNLGNSLDVVDETGKVNEKAINAKTTKKLIQAAKTAGFNTIKIPVTFLDLIGTDGTVNDVYMERIQDVVDYAYDMGMYSIVSLHGDGMSGFEDLHWLDIDAPEEEFNQILNKYGALWTDIAQAFTGYDQKVLFQSANELMNAAHDYNAAPTQSEYANINAINQTFVNAVRNAGGANNADRVLILVGYNSNIDYTIAGFKKPTDSTADRLILSVNYYTPSDFTLGNDGGSTAVTTWDENGAYGKSYMDSQFAKITNFANGLGMPVMIGEYGPQLKSDTDGNNLDQITNYDYWLNYYASLHGIATAYWDNGETDIGGTAIFDRTNNVITDNGEAIVAAIKSGYDAGHAPEE